jgi:hypothetical protein
MRDVSVVQTRRASALLIFLESEAYGGAEANTSESIPNDLRAEAIRTFAESSAHTMEKLHRLTTMRGNVFDASVPFQVAWVC